MVLRYKGDDTSTGLISLVNVEHSNASSNSRRSPLAKRIDDLNIYQTEDGNIKLSEQGVGAKFVATAANTWSVSKSYGVTFDSDGVFAYLSWSRSNFSSFCIDLLSALEGLPYNDKNRPSFGQIFDSVRLDKAPLQSSAPRAGYPHLTVSLHGGGSNGEMLAIEDENGAEAIEYWITVENEGYAETTMSDDMFKTSLVLPVGKKASKAVKYMISIRDKDRSIHDILSCEGMEFPYRLVYKAGQDQNEFLAVEKRIKILGSDISLF